MNSKELIATLYQEFQDNFPVFIVKRDTVLLEQEGLASCILGPRRVGKTYLLYDRIQHLKNQKIHSEAILYVNFEDDRLLSPDGIFLGKLIDSFYELFPDNYDRKIYLFFDEIQNVKSWSKPLRRFLDKLNCQIFVTGSSSKLLSKEMSTSLRGRTVTTTVYPLSFHEYQRFLSIPFLKRPSRKEMAIVQRQLTEYLMTGGLPLVIQSKAEIRTVLLREYFDLVIFKDVIERFEVQNISALNYIAKFCIKNHGRLFSGTKIYNDIKSQGFSISKDKLFEYLEHLNDAFLLFYVPIYSESIRKQNSNPKKVYTIDTGFARSFEFKSEEDLGRKFENLVFIDLLRRSYDVCYYRTNDGLEVDFIISKAGVNPRILQVCWDISDETTLARELLALKIAEKELGLRGQLITPKSFLTGEYLDFAL